MLRCARLLDSGFMKIKVTVPAQEWVLDVEPEDEEDIEEIYYDSYVHHCVTDVNYNVTFID